ncbi:Substrate-specific component BioY of biotin ECF transporter [hydrothermal vent metagenome]|uniref:Substrate-specific component BioY of biotin ECF transporter n=1 Tax=hydrothermal vent metagenome TaxID=652676 RepID=A0A3B0RJT5_9ZZZZ
MQTVLPSNVLLGVVFPRSKAITAALVFGFALFTAAMAQFVIPLGFTPVPITGQTLAVLLAGGVLGANAGAASQALYVVMGAVGLPFFADAKGGWTVATGSTAGYLVGFVVAAWLVGRLAERDQDRSVGTALGAFLLGSVTIYLFGVPWLANVIGANWNRAAELGAYPFIAGDLVKVAIAGSLLPMAWRLVDRTRR